MIKAYIRCNSGHYFSGEYCPLDGWTSAESRELADALTRVSGPGELSLRKLRQMGVSKTALRRAILVEFGSTDAVFEALAPEGYVLDHEWRPLASLDGRFK